MIIAIDVVLRHKKNILDINLPQINWARLFCKWPIININKCSSNGTLPHCCVVLNIIYIHKNQDDFS